MVLKDRNTLIDLIPKVIPARLNFENLLKAIGQGGVLVELPDGVSYANATALIVDLAIQRGWAGALTKELCARFPQRHEFVAIQRGLEGDVTVEPVVLPHPAPAVDSHLTERDEWRRRAQMPLALIIVTGAVLLLYVADGAADEQFRILKGCWPYASIVDGNPMPTVDFWNKYGMPVDLDWLSRFFYSRTGHRLFGYILVLGALVGWGGSVMLRVVQTEQAQGRRRPKLPPSWEGFFASIVLAALAGGILFLLMIGSRLMLDSDGCLSRGYTYVSEAAAIAAGLSIVAFFDWFDKLTTTLWLRVGGRQ